MYIYIYTYTWALFHALPWCLSPGLLESAPPASPSMLPVLAGNGAWAHGSRLFENLRSKDHWVDLRENLQETIDFPMK